MELPQFKTRRQASDHMIQLGFNYYYRPDIKTAMYRFNQAYLLDSTNTDIFWGYGAVYMALGRYDLAKEQYEQGLALNPANTHLLTDLATWFLGQFYALRQMPENDFIKNQKEQAKSYMDSALLYLNKSYELDSRDVNTAYKLSICYLNINDCANAWKYYDACMALGGQPVTAGYTSDLKKRCQRN
jgi:Tfp pilus assembly protein PilF